MTDFTKFKPKYYLQGLDIFEDMKITELSDKYPEGLGIAVYFVTINRLFLASENKLEMQDYVFSAIAKLCKLNPDRPDQLKSKVSEIILYSIDKCKLFKTDPNTGYFYSDFVNDSIEKMQSKRAGNSEGGKKTQEQNRLIKEDNERMKAEIEKLKST